MREHLQTLGTVSEWTTGDEEIPERYVYVYSRAPRGSQLRREPGEVNFLHRMIAIERYDRAEWSVALEFEASNGRHVLVQLMRPEAVRR